MNSTVRMRSRLLAVCFLLPFDQSRGRGLFGLLLGLLLTGSLLSGLAVQAHPTHNAPAGGPVIRYVKPGGTGTADGTSWANASGDLQAMITSSTAGQQVWVATGTYKPTTGIDRTVSFMMKNGVPIYGGFAATGSPALTERNPTSYTTVLSGDIGRADDASDNSYHVINNSYLTTTAVLDGFIVTSGNANGTGTDSYGGGIYNHSCSPTLINCIFQYNSATSGGAMFNGGTFSNSSPVLINCAFLNNAATAGGAIYNDGTDDGNSNPVLTNCAFLNNSASTGGAMYNAGFSSGNSNPVLTNCSFLNNTADFGGAMYNTVGKVGNSNPVLTNCVLFGNGGSNTFYTISAIITASYSLFDETVTGYTGSNNKTTVSSPFASASPGTPAGVALAANSPAIDAGSNEAYEKGPATDLAGNPRIFPTNGTIDMGAVELQSAPVSALTLTLSASPDKVLTTGTTTLSATVSGGTTPYSYTFSGPANITASGNTATVSGFAAGVKIFKVLARDNTTPTSQTISGTVSVTVTRDNRPPTAPTFDNQTVTVGTAFSYPVYGFTDPDGDPLEYSVSIDPVNGFSFDPSYIPTVSGTPTTTGVSTVTVTVTDPDKLSTSAIFTITVVPAVLIRYVKTGGTGDGSSWATASGNLQAMIDAPGVEQVWVASGIFKPTTTESNARMASFRMKNKVAIYGGFTGTENSLAARPPVNPVTGTPSSTTLSGDIGKPGDASDNSFHVFYHFYGSQLNGTAVLDGFVITGGNANIILQGFNNIGAGFLNLNSSPTLVNCSLQGNTATDNAGGIYNSGSSPTLTNCMLQDNSALSGGGIYNTDGSSPTLTNCSLLNNSATNNGGGIFNFNGSNPTLTNCILQNNYSASVGGGLYNGGSNPTLVNCSLQNNSSKQAGGALFNSGGNPTLVNCSLLGNSASEGGGIYNGGSNSVLTNCVLWDNGAGNTFSNNSSSVTATYSLFDNTVTGYNTDGVGNRTTSTSPFASGDVALAANSPAIDAGSNQAYEKGPATDLVGNPRVFPQNGTIDMGAVEFQTAPVVSGPFAITGVTTVSCTVLSAGQRQLSFVPRYSGLNGQPVSFSVANELLPTTAPGPYALKVYTDNPVITLKAVQTGMAGEASFAYDWLAACNTSTAPNTPPRVAMGIPAQTATVGSYFSYVIAEGTFTDAETPASLRLSAAGVPAGLSFTGVTLSGTPVTTAGSPVSLTITATDPGGLSASTELVLTVQPAPGTPPPTMPFSITGVTTISCTPVANRISISFAPRYAGMSGQAIAFEVVNETLPTTEPAPYSLTLYRDNPVITLRATQTGSGGPVTFSYNWLIACNSAGQDNTAPRLNEPVASQTARVGQGYSLNLSNTFIDQETPEQITLTAADLPAGLSLSGKFISGTPSLSGESKVTLTSTDGGGLSTSTSFSFIVLPASIQPPTNPPTTAPFSITGVTTVNCEMVSAGQRKVTFTPRYAGLDGSPVSFRVVNETLPTTNSGPYTLNLYTDNPVITLQATQSGVVSQFSYGWLSVCNPGARVGAGPEVPLTVTVLGNPVVDESVEVEVRGADGQTLTLSITDVLGHRVVEQSVGRTGIIERQTLRLGQVAAGVLLLRVSTSTQSRTVKVIKSQ